MTAVLLILALDLGMYAHLWHRACVEAETVALARLGRIAVLERTVARRNATIHHLNESRDDACIASSAARAKLAFAERTISETQARIPDAVSQLEAAVGEARALFNRVLVETAP